MAAESFAKKYGPWALITGASSGLGAEFARQLAERGLNLALVARRQDRLDELGAQLERESGIATRSIPMDLTNHEFLAGLRASVSDLDIGLLVHSAGFGTTGTLPDSDLEGELDMLDVNCRACLQLVHTLAGSFRERGRGGIIMLSSVGGLMPFPYIGGYSATKAWNVFLGDALHVELKPHGVDVLSLCPGPVRTGFFDVAGTDEKQWPFFARSTIMDADDVVAEALAKLGKRNVVVPGIPYRIMVGSARLLPRRLTAQIAGYVTKMTWDRDD